MTKSLKNQLINKLLESGNYFYLRPIANSLGINHMTRLEVMSVVGKYLKLRPDMTAYYDDSNNKSLFCGVWFASKTMIFEDGENFEAEEQQKDRG